MMFAFVGYEFAEIQTELLQYRKVKAKGKEQFQFVLSKTPFYAEIIYIKWIIN